MTWLLSLHDRLEALLGARTLKLVRYLVSGGMATAANLIIFFLLVHFGHMYYLHASILAFAMSVTVSFTMQKFWTFRDQHLYDVHAQFARYLVVILSNLLLNTALIYLLVEKFGQWYLFAQILATAIVAVTGYFGYRHFVFRDRAAPPLL
jgi:putative flippase GtrA